MCGTTNAKNVVAHSLLLMFATGMSRRANYELPARAHNKDYLLELVRTMLVEIGQRADMKLISQDFPYSFSFSIAERAPTNMIRTACVEGQ